MNTYLYNIVKPIITCVKKQMMVGFIIVGILPMLTSCGTDGHHFKFEGRLLNINQGEFYVYSTDGAISGMDTIRVQAGRFSYIKECQSEGTLMIVFPNFSEQPVFVAPGASLDMKGDVSHLKEVEVTGSKANKLMNSFREHVANMSPDETKKYAAQFIADNPTSIVSIYLVEKYYLRAQMSDYKESARLLTLLQKAQPENTRLSLMQKQLAQLAKNDVGKRLQSFKAKDINGKEVNSKDLMTGDAIIYVWASWEFESCSIQRILGTKDELSDYHIIGISLDASAEDCKRIVERDKVEWSIICDEKMLDGSLVHQLGISSIPDNIILKNGKITSRNLSTQEIRDLAKK